MHSCVFLFSHVHLCAYATKSDEGASHVLVLGISHIGTDESNDILPRPSFDYFSFESVGIFPGGVVSVFRIHVAHHLVTRLGISGGGPFGYISGHIEKPEVVGSETAHFRRNQVSVGGIGSLSGFKVGHVAIVVVFYRICFPGKFVFRFSVSASHFPFGFGRQPVSFDFDLVASQSAQ